MKCEQQSCDFELSTWLVNRVRLGKPMNKNNDVKARKKNKFLYYLDG